jgi:hypothetical protein
MLLQPPAPIRPTMIASLQRELGSSNQQSSEGQGNWQHSLSPQSLETESPPTPANWVPIWHDPPESWPITSLIRCYLDRHNLSTMHHHHHDQLRTLTKEQFCSKKCFSEFQRCTLNRKHVRFSPFFHWIRFKRKETREASRKCSILKNESTRASE